MLTYTKFFYSTTTISVDDCHPMQAMLPIGSTFYFDFDADPDPDRSPTIPHDLRVTIFIFLQSYIPHFFIVVFSSRQYVSLF
jgi:hypothetical protein